MLPVGRETVMSERSLDHVKTRLERGPRRKVGPVFHRLPRVSSDWSWPQALCVLPQPLHLLQAHLPETTTSALGHRLDVAEPGSKPGDGFSQGILCAQIQEPGQVDEAEQQVPQFPLDPFNF